jgi:peptidoglycan/xylan/chitin deacetylase (PgdA/CDA1 family)
MPRIKEIAAGLLQSTGLLHAGLWLRSRMLGERSLILSFHAVCDPARPGASYFRPGMSIDADQFEALLDLLGRHYRVVPLAEAVEATRGPRRPGRPPVAITFDDGYRSVLDVALPLLVRRKMPATVFLATDFIGTGKRLWWDEVDALIARAAERLAPTFDRLFRGGPLAGDAWRSLAADPGGRTRLANEAVSRLKYMTEAERETMLAAMRTEAGPPAAGTDPSPMLDWAEVRRMREAGVDFQSHGAAHLYLDAIPVEAARADLEESTRRIEAELGYRPRYLAYPDGRHDEALREEIRRQGFLGAVATARGGNRANCDVFRLRRMEVTSTSRTRGKRPSRAAIWCELLGIWDLVFLRRWRSPQEFTDYRPSVSAAPASPSRTARGA